MTQNLLPRVALESTVITHGLAYPANLRTAQDMERSVREGGAEPSTIAIINGEIKIGLTAGELEYLATTKGARKCSVRDIGIVVGLGGDGATTVAATMFLAARAGIGVFATGGIGGVHRGHPFDVSADLTELSRTPVTVVCAGAKALLDLPLTFEHLETLGVPVLAVDGPSALDLSSGEPSDPCVRADVTVTFHRPKTGLRTRIGKALAGHVLVAPIGIPPEADPA